MKLTWIAGADGNTLCADGYPIRIKRTRAMLTQPPFMLEADGHVPTSGYWTLASAKADGARFAAEMREFSPPDA